MAGLDIDSLLPFDSDFTFALAFSVASCIISSSFFSCILVLTSSRGLSAVRTYVVKEGEINKA
jgi:hypothetical protein